jgi:RHS repeat-associated protein
VAVAALIALVVSLSNLSPGIAEPSGVRGTAREDGLAHVQLGDERGTGRVGPLTTTGTKKSGIEKPAVTATSALTDQATSPRGDRLSGPYIKPTDMTSGGPSVCGNRSVYYTGLKVQYCADLDVFDAATGTATAPPTNSQSDTTWDACGNVVFSGNTTNWYNPWTDPIVFTGLAGSRTYTIPAVPFGCYGYWTVQYTFTQTFTNGEQLTVVGSRVYEVYLSRAHEEDLKNPQPPPDGDPIRPDEELGGCGSTRSTHEQETDYPIDTATGNFWHTFTDLNIPGRGPAFLLERTYNSHVADQDGAFGFGWSDNYGQRLERIGDTAILHGCKGARTRFTLSNGAWQAAPRVLGGLTQEADGSWVFDKAGQETYRFDTAGRLTSIADRNGERTQVTYPDGQTRIVTDPAGRAVVFEFNNNHVVTVREAAAPQRTVTYGYDTAGNLTRVTDVAGGRWTFSYDAAHRMLTMRSPRWDGVVATPEPVVTNTYDDQGRIVAQSDPLGRRTTFDYTTPGTTVVTNPAGNSTAYEYRDGLLVFETKGYGSSTPSYWMYRYDPATLGRTMVVDGNGGITRAAYEADGDRASETSALGNQTTYTYNAQHQVKTITSPRTVGGTSVTTTFTYDGNGNLATVSTPLLDAQGSVIESATTRYEHADLAHPGDVTAVIDPNGHKTTQTYDGFGNLTAVRQPPTAENPEGNTTTYHYEVPARGWLTSSTSARGNLPGADPAGFTTHYGHNLHGQVTSTRSPLWTSEQPTRHQSINEYNPDGNLTAITDGAGNTTRLTYDAAGQATTLRRADGSVSSTTYGLDGTVAKQTNAAGDETVYTYNALGHLTSERDPLQRVWRYTTDRNGHVVTAMDPQGRTTDLIRNSAGQVTRINYSDPDTPDVNGITYDAEGRRISLTDGTGTSTWNYDSLGRLASTSDGAGATITYEYDLAGRQTAIGYPNSLGTVTKTYDSANRLVQLNDLSNHATTFSYDSDSNLVEIERPNGTSTTYAIDAAHQVRTVSHLAPGAAGGLLASYDYTYDGAGRMASEVAGTGTGEPTTQTYGYDQTNQLTSVNSTTATYDKAGNLTKRFDGVVQSFDAAGQLRRTRDSSITKVGIASATGSTGSSLQLTLPAGTAAGDQAILSVSLPGGKTVDTPASYTPVASYDGGRNGAAIAVFRKTLSSSDTTVTVPFTGKFDKTATLAVYRNVHAVSPLVDSVQGKTITGTSLELPGLAATDGDRLIWTAAAAETPGTWNPPDGMTTQVSTKGGKTDSTIADQPLALTGNTGPRVGTHSVTAGLAGVILALRPIATDYTYDASGNRVAATSPDGTTVPHTYDMTGRLTTYGSNASYSYNADGLRVTKTIAGSTKRFTWDTSNGLGQLLSDGDAAYIYGPGGTPLQRVTTGGATGYFGLDATSSTRLLTNDAGASTASYRYNPFGSPADSSGNTTNPMTYKGEYVDSESGYVYLRARSYDPATGQFLTKDPLNTTTGEPYAYASNNPLNLSDPSGLCPACICLLVCTGVGVGAGTEVGIQVLKNLANGCDPFYNLNWKQIAIAATIGGATGGVVNWVRAAKYGDEAIEGIGGARSYVDLTKGGSIRNVGTNATHTEFAETLINGGWISRTSKDGAVQIFERDGAKYILRSKNSSGYPGWTADFTPAGSAGHTLEIRLGYMP